MFAADEYPHCGQQITDLMDGVWGLLIVAAYVAIGFLFNRYAHSELHDFTKENKFWCALMWPLFAILFVIGWVINIGETKASASPKEKCDICRGGKHYVGKSGVIHKCECVGGWIPDSEKPKNPPKRR